VESQQPSSQQTDTTLSRPQNHSQLEGIVDLLQNIACIELQRRLLSVASSIPTGEARSRFILKTVILFIAVYGYVTYDKRGKSLWAGLLQR
jgi:hypothetical protein